MQKNSKPVAQQRKRPDEIDEQTQALLEKLSIPLTGAFNLGAGAISKGKVGTAAARVAGDIPLYAQHKVPLAMAFQEDTPREDRMNALLNLGAQTGVDLGSDALVRGAMALLASKGINVSPTVTSGLLLAKNYGMAPVYNAMGNAIYDNNLGPKAADAVKRIDSLINNSTVQRDYANMYPMLQELAMTRGADRNVTSPEVAIGEKQFGFGDAGRVLTKALPANTRPAANDAISQVEEAGVRKATGLVRDVKKVTKGVSPYVKTFGRIFNQMITGNAPTVTTGKIK